MKKAIFIIACFAVIFIALSAFTDRAVAPASGYKAPSIQLRNDSNAVSINRLPTGRYTILAFWTASNAQSRLMLNGYAALADKTDDLSLVGVNLDPSDNLYREVIKRDRLNPSMQYRVESTEATKVSNLYHLSNGVKSFLIGPDGTIIAVNPDAQQVKTLLES